MHRSRRREDDTGARLDVPDLVPPGRLTRWRREPLVHFAAIGLALFALQAWLAPPADDRRIVVTTAMRRGLANEHLRRQGAPPTPAEERAAVDRYVDTEVMVREALALGLDRGDIIVRRRLVQKMEFLNEGLAAVPEPTDADLAAYLDAHPERYTVADRIGLEHVFVSTDAHPEDAAVVAAELRGALEGGADPATLGDPFLRGRSFRGQSARDLDDLFGPAFAAAALQLPAGQWSVAIPSSYGLHLVRVTARDVQHRPTVDEVRSALVRDWRTERRAEAGRAALARLRAGYDVRIEDAP